VFRSTEDLVLVDVSVLDRDGTPVPGLTAADFRVTLDGQTRPVRAVTYERAVVPATGVAGAASSNPARREVSNAAPAGEPRVFVLLVDDLSLAASRGRGLLASAGRFVSGLPAADAVGLTTSSGAAVINPTLDHGAVAAALDRIVGDFIDPRSFTGPPVGIDEAIDIVNGSDATLRNVIARDCNGGGAVSHGNYSDGNSSMSSPCAEEVTRKARVIGGTAGQTAARQMQAYTAAITAMRPAPGLKHLVLISDGLAVPNRAEGASDLGAIARAAAAAGVQLTVLSEEPDATLDAPGFDPYNANPSEALEAEVRRTDETALRSGLRTMADMAGGSYDRVIGTPDPFFKQVAVSSSAIYRLGVELPGGSPPGRDFSLSVRVDRPGLTLRANRHAVAPEPAAVLPIEKRLRDAAAAGAPLYGVPLTLGTAIRGSASPGTLDLDANVEIPGDVPGPVTVVFGLRDATRELRSGQKRLESPPAGENYRLSLSLPVPAGSYHLCFAVADAQGRIGSVDEAVTARLHRIGPFLASDLLTGWSRSEAEQPRFLALETVPAAATRLSAVLDLYPEAGAAPAPGPVRVRLTLLADGQADPIDQEEVLAMGDAGTLRASGDFALDRLPPGRYLLRATVFTGTTSVGELSVAVRKAGS
jgi:VWFA-related protein